MRLPFSTKRVPSFSSLRVARFFWSEKELYNACTFFFTGDGDEQGTVNSCRAQVSKQAALGPTRWGKKRPTRWGKRSSLGADRAGRAFPFPAVKERQAVGCHSIFCRLAAGRQEGSGRLPLRRRRVIVQFGRSVRSGDARFTRPRRRCWVGAGTGARPRHPLSPVAVARAESLS